MNEKETKKTDIEKNSPQVLDLMLDVILEVMQAEHGSIMLLDDKSQELTIRSARGLKNEIIQKTRVRLGSGISGRVAATGRSVFLKNTDGERRINIKPDEMYNPDIKTSYVAPIKLHDKTVGTVNIKSTRANNEIRAEKEKLVQGILYRFLEYIAQSEIPSYHHETVSQVYMMNVFREYNTLRELRVVFDFVFHLITDLLEIKKKGVFLLKNPESNFFELVLGYGFDTKMYREIYEGLIPQLNEPRVESASGITIFNRKELFSNATKSFNEEFLILMPMVWRDKTPCRLFLFADKKPTLVESKKDLIQSVCEAVARSVEESQSGRGFHELTFTDSLTGTYNYGLWWKRFYEEFSRITRLKDPAISLILINIDHFNRFNVAHGYLVGDQLLRVIADRIKSCLRLNDLLGRIGGDEFGVVLPDTSKEDALKVANRILNVISGIQTEMRIELSDPCTLSGGVVGFPDDADTPETLVEKGKNALVAAKIMGGNRIKAG